MSMPGWYHDPSGSSGQFRYWDGHQWSHEVSTDPSVPPPAPSGPSGATGPAAGHPGSDHPLGGQPGSGQPAEVPWQPATGPKRSLVPVMLLAAAAVALTLVVALVVTQVFGGGDDPIEPTEPLPPVPTTETGGTETGGTETEPAPGGGELNCLGGNGRSADAQQSSYSAAGVTVDVPEDWGFRFDKSLWVFLDDQAAWGRTLDGEEVEGMVLGGLAGYNGFDAPEEASDQVITCIVDYGPYAGEGLQPEPIDSGSITLGGLDGWQRTFAIDQAGVRTVFDVNVLDSGDPESLAVVVTFGPESSAATLEQVRESVSRQ